MSNLFRTVGGTKWKVYLNGQEWAIDGRSYSTTVEEAQERAIEMFMLADPPLVEDDIVEIRHDPPVPVREMSVPYLTLLTHSLAQRAGAAPPGAPDQPTNPLPDPVDITTTSLPDPQEGVAYSQTVAATGGQAPFTFTVTAGALPAGLSLNAATGAITGTPSAAGAASFTITATDSQATPDADSQAYNVTVAAANPSYYIITESLLTPTVGVSYFDDVDVSGGVEPHTWSISAGSLPPGLNLISQWGDISGTPTTAGLYTFTVTVTDNVGATVSREYTLDVQGTASVNITTTGLSAGVQNTAMSRQLVATGGTTPYTWSVLSGALPAGLSLNASTGEISGTPTTVETASFTIRVTDNVGATDDQALTLQIMASGSMWFAEEWLYADTTEMANTPGVGQSGGGGWAIPEVLPSPGPWGGSNIINVQFNAAPAEWQPQAGAYRDFPYPVDEFWMETWLRFDSHWTTLPFNPLYPGNTDHKTWFVYPEGFTNRWEFKMGVYTNLNIFSAHNHDTHYIELWNPPLPIDPAARPGHKSTYPQGILDMSTEVWDNQWHHVQVHCKLDSGPEGSPAGDGECHMWWDGNLVCKHESLSMNHWSGSPATKKRFFRYVFGANRNSGPEVQMGFQWGPVYTYITNPGWSTAG